MDVVRKCKVYIGAPNCVRYKIWQSSRHTSRVHSGPARVCHGFLFLLIPTYESVHLRRLRDGLSDTVHNIVPHVMSAMYQHFQHSIHVPERSNFSAVYRVIYLHRGETCYLYVSRFVIRTKKSGCNLLYLANIKETMLLSFFSALSSVLD